MGKSKKGRYTLTEERDIALFEEYNKVVRSFGENARYMSKRKMYEEAARPFFISTESARNIIQRMMRTRQKHASI